jgi:hypothetical protein
VLWVAATDPPSLVIATQCHLTRQSVIPFEVPFLCQVRPPNRHHRVASRPGLLNTAHRAPSVLGTPSLAPSLVWGMALWTQPEILFITALGHLVGREIAGVPFLRKSGVIFHGPAWAKLVVLAYTVGADYVFSAACQIFNTGLPFMLPATIMNAAWAPQPDPLFAPVREVSRHLARIAGWVPRFLDELVGGVCQRFLPLVVDPHTCDRRSKYYCGLNRKMLSVACFPNFDSDCDPVDISTCGHPWDSREYSV